MTSLPVAAMAQATRCGQQIDWPKTVLLLVILGAVIAAAGFAIGYLLTRTMGRQPRPTAPTSPQVATAIASTDTELPATTTDGATGRQRAALIAGCMRLLGILDDQVSIGVLDQALTASGVERFDPIGARLEPSRHRITATAPAPDPASDGIVAHTTAPGYTDAGRVLQPAAVVVYRWNQS